MSKKQLDEAQAISDVTDFVMSHLIANQRPFDQDKVLDVVQVMIHHRVAVGDILEGNQTQAQQHEFT